MQTHLKSHRGSALIFTMLLLFILSILGSVLISAAMTNFTLTCRGGAFNTAYYLADGAAGEILAEMEILTENAEFEALSELETYAASIGEAYVTILTDDDASSHETACIYDKTGFGDDLEARFREYYFSRLASGLQDAVSDLAFNPSFKDSFEEKAPLSAAFSSPDTILKDLKAGSEIFIEVVGRYDGLQRKLRISFRLPAPAYAFDVEERETVIVLKGLNRTGPAARFTLVSWKETNPNP